MDERLERATDPRPLEDMKQRCVGPRQSDHPTVTERRRSREQPRPHFKRLAQTWSGMVGVEITPVQAVLMLAALKMVREWYMHDADNVTDAEGYLSMVEEVR